jgi:ribosomal protein S27AE
MTRCVISEQIAEYCNQPEEIECPGCGSSMAYDNDGDLQCDKCDHEIIMDDADYSEDFE